MSPAARPVRAIRGATTVAVDESAEVLAATRELLEEMIVRNELTSEDVVSVFFTATPDLRSAFPARAARELGWNDVPLLCAESMDVAGSGAPARCIRVLAHVESERPRSEIRHVYLRGARLLRPDLVSD